MQIETKATPPVGNVVLKYFFQKNATDNLFVFFNGAADRSKCYPIFHRVGWEHDFPGSCLYISDPLLEKNDKLTIGWYIGGRNFDVEAAVDALILSIVNQLEPKNIISWGSSAGGYASLRLASRMKGVNAVAVNPQTNIFKYHPRHVNEYFEVAFSGENILDHKNHATFNVLKSPAIDSKYCLVQNVLDAFHYKHHYTPLLETAKNENFESRVCSLIYSSPTGHGPEKREMVPEIFSAFSIR